MERQLQSDLRDVAFRVSTSPERSRDNAWPTRVSANDCWCSLRDIVAATTCNPSKTVTGLPES
jgi:hypothetical protein